MLAFPHFQEAPAPTEKSPDTIYISNLSTDVTEDKLADFFGSIGIIKVRTVSFLSMVLCHLYSIKKEKCPQKLNFLNLFYQICADGQKVEQAKEYVHISFTLSGPF